MIYPLPAETSRRLDKLMKARLGPTIESGALFRFQYLEPVAISVAAGYAESAEAAADELGILAFEYVVRGGGAAVFHGFILARDTVHLEEILDVVETMTT